MSGKLMGKAFLLLWTSESLFLISNALMSFALSVWIFEQSDSVELFSYVLLASTLPSLLLQPFAGMFADHFDKRWVIVCCDIAAVLMVCMLAYLALRDALSIQHLYAFAAGSAAVGAIRRPSYQVAVSHIVPRQSLARANGLSGATMGLAQIGAPIIAGHALARGGVQWVMELEVAIVVAATVAAFAALSTRVAAALRHAEDRPRIAAVDALKSSYASVAGYFKTHPLMLALLVYTLVEEALTIVASSLLTPLILARHGSDVLGWVLTVGAVGGMAGSLLLVGANLNRHLVMWVLVSDVALALLVATMGIVTTPQLWCICAFGAFACSGVSKVCAATLWMRKVPISRQGSVFAALAAANSLAMCTMLWLAGRTVDQVMEPLMMAGGPLAEQLGGIVGTGKGRGVALMFVLAGALFLSVSLLAMLHPRLRRLDAWVPDQEAGNPLSSPAPDAVDIAIVCTPKQALGP